LGTPRTLLVKEVMIKTYLKPLLPLFEVILNPMEWHKKCITNGIAASAGSTCHLGSPSLEYLHHGDPQSEAFPPSTEDVAKCMSNLVQPGHSAFVVEIAGLV